MPSLSGFSDNQWYSNQDVRVATLVLLRSLQQYQSPGGARFRIPTSTGAHFDETAAQLEGYARPLWVVATLLQGSPDDEEVRELVEPFVRGLASGTDPAHDEYWGPLQGTDQRMVEMEIISFALLAAPETFYRKQSTIVQSNIAVWLKSINDYPLPITNWLFFRVLTNLALVKCCEVPRTELWPLIEKDLATLDSFYLENGWSADGPWSEKQRQADYYSGSFAIQFSQLLYVRFAADIDPERCNTYRERARAFAADFVLYFDRNGAAIPFGRSLTYRFAFAGFWAAAAYAGVELPSPVDQPGAVKGLLLRHLRWWSSKPAIFNIDGTLNIGFAYPNMYMCEDYNSPQSVYWCMKSLVVLGLPLSHSFWTEQESDLSPDAIPLNKALRAPMQILCNSGPHHFLLSSGQFCAWPLKATEAKYGKFAYSSAFGFSVPTGPLLPQMAPDSTLALSIDGGESWKVRWRPLSPKWATATLIQGDRNEKLPVLVSGWKPWSMFDVTVTTVLIPPSSRWPDWHIRVHKLSNSATLSGIEGIAAVEGGFAITGRKASDGRPITIATTPHAPTAPPGASGDGPIEIIHETSAGCCIFSASGASGVYQLTVPAENFQQQHTRGSLLKPDANTNLMEQRTVIPTLRRDLVVKGIHIGEHLMTAAVFATTDTSFETLERWADVPVLHLGTGKRLNQPAYIEFDGW